MRRPPPYIRPMTLDVAHSSSRQERGARLRTVRICTLLCPPLGLILLWRARELGLGRKILGTIFIPLYSLLYAAALIALLLRFSTLEIEWRGGLPPVLTLH